MDKVVPSAARVAVIGGACRSEAAGRSRFSWNSLGTAVVLIEQDGLCTDLSLSPRKPSTRGWLWNPHAASSTARVFSAVTLLCSGHFFIFAFATYSLRLGEDNLLPPTPPSLKISPPSLPGPALGHPPTQSGCLLWPLLQTHALPTAAKIAMGVGGGGRTRGWSTQLPQE